MKKKIKVIAWILFGFLAAAVLVFYIIKPSETKAAIGDAWAFLNKPLPIVGFTTLMVLLFVWKVFIQTKYGQKAIAKFKERCDELENSFAEEKAKLEEHRKTINTENQLFRKEIIDNCTQICEAIPNVKVKKIGEKLKGSNYEKEEIVSPSKE